jgi:hypothetical protein
MSEFMRARKKAKWPVQPLRQGTVLPNLHTLEICPFCLHPGILTLPSLHCVGYRLDMPTTSEQSKTILDQVLGDTYHHLTHMTYWGPTTTIWDILDRLPNVTELTFGAISDNTTVVSPHRHLCLSAVAVPIAISGFQVHIMFSASVLIIIISFSCSTCGILITSTCSSWW